jgi:hypothetical protein
MADLKRRRDKGMQALLAGVQMPPPRWGGVMPGMREMARARRVH